MSHKISYLLLFTYGILNTILLCPLMGLDSLPNMKKYSFRFDTSESGHSYCTPDSKNIQLFLSQTGGEKYYHGICKTTKACIIVSYEKCMVDSICKVKTEGSDNYITSQTTTFSYNKSLNVNTLIFEFENHNTRVEFFSFPDELIQYAKFRTVHYQ